MVSVRACDEECYNYNVIQFTSSWYNMQDTGCTAWIPTTVAVTEQSFSPTKSQPVFLDPPCCVVQQYCDMQSSDIYMIPVEEINQCHNSADLVVASCETVDQCCRMMEQHVQSTNPVNETPRPPVEEMNHCHNRADLVVGRVELDPHYCWYTVQQLM